VPGPGLDGESGWNEWDYLELCPPLQVVTVDDMEISIAAANTIITTMR